MKTKFGAIMNIREFFKRFWFGEEKKKGIEYIESFTEEQKQQIVNCALTTCCQILISTAVMTNSHNEIRGDCILPDGTKWTLTFNRIEKPTP